MLLFPGQTDALAPLLKDPEGKSLIPFPKFFYHLYIFTLCLRKWIFYIILLSTLSDSFLFLKNNPDYHYHLSDHYFNMTAIANTWSCNQYNLQLAPTSVALPPTFPAQSLRVRSPVRRWPGFVVQSPDSRQALQVPNEESDQFKNEDNQSHTTFGIGSVLIPNLVEPALLNSIGAFTGSYSEYEWCISMLVRDPWPPFLWISL